MLYIRRVILMVKIPSVDIERVNKLETATLALG